MKKKAFLLALGVAAILVASLFAVRAGYRESSEIIISSNRLVYGDNKPDLAPWSQLVLPKKRLGDCSVADAWIEPSSKVTARSIFGYRLKGKVEPRTLVFVLLDIPSDPMRADDFSIQNAGSSTTNTVNVDFKRYWLYSTAIKQGADSTLSFQCGESTSTATIASEA